uniref:Uncharacterized protein n=1 Tax=Cyprinodon variegatus TaxID=28743 RepID=A0A3Q2E3S7_CYPVA
STPHRVSLGTLVQQLKDPHCQPGYKPRLPVPATKSTQIRNKNFWIKEVHKEGNKSGIT